MEMLNDLVQELGAKVKILEGDVKDMAWVWEETISDIHEPSVLVVYSSLRAITRSYLRGRGLRMGNWQGFKKYGFIEAKLITCIAAYVVREGSIVFGALHKAGLTSAESFTARLLQEREKLGGKDILDEVRRMLDGGETCK